MTTTIPNTNPLPSPDRSAHAAALRLVPGAPGRQLSLPYEYDVSPGVPAVPPVPTDLHLVGRPEVADPDLPDPGRWAARLARAVAEVAGGQRPPAQLTRWVARDELARLARRGNAMARHPSARAKQGVSRLRVVRSVRVCPVAPGIVETCAVLVGGDRAQAVAIRLELVDGQWFATAVQLG